MVIFLQCDVVTVNCPLHEGTKGLVNTELLKHFKKGAWLVNTARGAICDKDAVAAALKSGQLSGYSGDVWNVQPAPQDHVWRTMKNPIGGGNGMVPHYSGTTLDAQARYANGTKKILENYFSGSEQNPPDIIIGKTGYETKACEFEINYVTSLHVLLTIFLRRWSTQVKILLWSVSPLRLMYALLTYSSNQTCL